MAAIELHENCIIHVKNENEILTEDIVTLKELGFDLFDTEGGVAKIYEMYLDENLMRNVLKTIAVELPENFEYKKVRAGKVKTAIYSFFEPLGIRFQG